MHELHLILNDEEHKYLVDLLDGALKEARVEERRSSPSYRPVVAHREEVFEHILKKLREPQPV